VSVLQLQRPYDFVSPFPGEAFTALLLVVDQQVTAEDQAALASSLVDQRCRYAVCTGHDSSSWDDAIDYAYVMNEVEGRPTHGSVTTSWHDREPLEEW
jgi:hypothetical protein